jgi:hypothetical protein
VNRTFPGGVWELIASPVTNSAVTQGTFAWVVSGPAAALSARIRVTWITNPAVSDFSNANFSIVP